MSRRLPPEPVLWTDAVAEAAQADLSARLAQNVRAARAETGLSQERAAERAALSWIYWRQLEAGKSNPTLRVLAQVAVALGVEPGRLLLHAPASQEAKPSRAVYPEPPFPSRTLHERKAAPAPATGPPPKKPGKPAPVRKPPPPPAKKPTKPRAPSR